MSDREELAEAAIAIVFNAEGRILVVTRPEPPHEYSIPGGTVEPGEHQVTTAIRELAEECGIVVEELRHCAVVRSPSDGRRVHVYRVDAWSGAPAALEPDTRIAWMTPEELFAQARLYRPTLRELMAAGLLSA
jgi:ADP-ribose pyrophosphatase YjhB (NUDIX family)